MPDHLKAKILINLLEEKSNNLLTYISDEHITNYRDVKNIVLREYLQVCLENFRTAEMKSDKTYIQFASRLTTNWECYCKLRKVKTFHKQFNSFG